MQDPDSPCQDVCYRAAFLPRPFLCLRVRFTRVYDSPEPPLGYPNPWSATRRARDITLLPSTIKLVFPFKGLLHRKNPQAAHTNFKQVSHHQDLCISAYLLSIIQDEGARVPSLLDPLTAFPCKRLDWRITSPWVACDLSSFYHCEVFCSFLRWPVWIS